MINTETLPAILERNPCNPIPSHTQRHPPAGGHIAKHAPIERRPGRQTESSLQVIPLKGCHSPGATPDVLQPDPPLHSAMLQQHNPHPKGSTAAESSGINPEIPPLSPNHRCLLLSPTARLPSHKVRRNLEISITPPMQPGPALPLTWPCLLLPWPRRGSYLLSPAISGLAPLPHHALILQGPPSPPNGPQTLKAA